MRALRHFLWAVFLWLPAAQAQGVLPVPLLTARVIDTTGTLDAIQLKGLDDKLAAFEREKGTQIAFLLVPTTQPEDIGSYANRVANDWKIGRKGVGDGVLLVVAKNDRKVRIEVAKTLEGAVPDLAARQIIDSAITPNFRKDDYAGGLSMHRYDALCLDAIPAYSSASIRALRARHKLSQAVFATVLNTSLSTVRQWEIGEKRPSGPSLKLLNLMDRKGLEVLI